MIDRLRYEVYKANVELQKQGLVILSWGNVSGIDRQAGIVVIKPSGISYEDLTPDKMVAVDLTGRKLEEGLDPSSDTLTHVELYKSFQDIAGICHTHSLNAAAWAQACKVIPCLGTTHADHFYGPVPVTGIMTDDQIQSGYESNTGKIIVRHFEVNNINPAHMPACLVANHGPFTWGTSAADAVQNAIILEQTAAIALATMQIDPDRGPVSKTLLDKHYLRKHGKEAYYGQKN
ncbi:MAG: L-ribulose-5-phosphate 4-epimerase AraD [Planctomycetota bacterium]